MDKSLAWPETEGSRRCLFQQGNHRRRASALSPRCSAATCRRPPRMMYVAGKREVSMTAEEFAEAVGELIAVAREGGLSDTKMIVLLEDAVERLDERSSAA
jgi:hypothetical protein